MDLLTNAFGNLLRDTTANSVYFHSWNCTSSDFCCIVDKQFYKQDYLFHLIILQKEMMQDLLGGLQGNSLSLFILRYSYLM